MVKQVRAARTREALIRAAAEVFAEDGYALASLPSISKRAGVSTGALHFHFMSKDVLAGAVEREAATAAARLAERSRSAGPPLQSLLDVCSGLLHALADDPVVRAGFRLSADPSRKAGAELLDWWHDRVRTLVVEARRAGELGEAVSEDAATTVLVSSTVGFGVLGAVDRAWLSVDRVAPLWSFLAPHLAASPHEAPAPVVTGERRSCG
ncbi:ScbR family autoregulator-binding transcription factor [Streptomyces sp. MK7]|uniref:ScbR family autoregulator-binding transcription factor n=1 Tax=Streptomyces sp. MK7 TaxID=3067635 RepID=UPI00292E9C60|nr:ScbR family autoregulator-binding transcription factor [Streptomyces sp. MK7]